VNKALRILLSIVPPLAWLVLSLFAHPQSQSSQPSPSAQQPQAQSQTQQKEDSVAEAARKAKEKKAVPAQRKVFTEDDLSGMRKEDVSVVGNENKKSIQTAKTPAPEGEVDPNSEQYWREKARPILEEMAVVNQQIEQLKEEIRKYGNAGFDVATGLKDNVAYVRDRNAKIEKLQKRKTALEKQLDDLQDEGRKAGAEPAWFR
jgi:chromosome segregation ATPase